MGVELEVWRARIGLFCGGRGSKKLKALLAYRRLFRRDAVAWATGETTNCTLIAIQAIIAGLPLLLMLRFLGSCWNKIKCTHLAKFHGGLSYLWNKDPKTLVSSAVHVALVLSTAVPLYRCILLILSGDVELNPGPQMDTVLTSSDLHQIHTKLYEARTKWFDVGQGLSVDHETLCSIRGEFSNDGDRLRAMIAQRLESSDHLTWAILCNCLRETIVSRAGLANDIEKKLEEDEEMQKDKRSAAKNICDGGSKKSFPSLKGVSEKEHQDRMSELESESEEMDSKFNQLSIEICQSLIDRTISKARLVMCVTGLNTVKKVYGGPDQCLLRKQRRKLQQSKTIEDVWLTISDYFSFFNYELVKVIALNLGTDDDKKKVESYEESFQIYAKRRIYECPSEFGSKLTAEEDSMDLIVKLDQTYDECEMSQLKTFVKKISTILELEYGVMRLCRVYPGCYELIFQVPSIVVQDSDVFPLTADQEAALKALHVLFLTCGGYKFFSRTHQDNQDPSDDSDEDDNNLSEDGHAESPPTEFDVPVLLEHSNPKKVPSSHADSGVGKSVTRTQTKKSEFSEVTSLCDEDKYLYAGVHFQAFDLQRTSDELPPLVKPASSNLHPAAWNGDIGMIRFAVEVLHCNVLEINRQGYSALHVAAEAGNMDIIKYFVENRNVNPSTESTDQMTPLHIAAYNGHQQLVEYFVREQLMDPLCLDKKLFSPLHYACLSGNLKVINYFIQTFSQDQAININDTTKTGHTILHFAAASGSVELVNFLIMNSNSAVSALPVPVLGECDVNVKDQNGNSALFVASQNGHVQTVEILLQKGAHVNSQNIEGTSALYIASQNGHVRTVEFLLQKGAHVNSQTIKGNSALFVASQNGHVQTVEILLQKGADVNSQNIKGNSALYIASQNGHVRTVEILLQKGAHVNSQNIDLVTPLMIAAHKGHIKVVTTLVERGADVNAKEKDFWTPLMYAAQDGHVDIVRTLVERGADVSAKNKKGISALYIASQNGHVRTVEILLQKGADVNSQNIEGYSALYIASQNGHVRTVEILLQKGADVNSQNIEGYSALFVASQNGHVRTVEILLQKGADVNSQNINKGNSALYIASQNGHVRTVEILLQKGAHVNSQNIEGYSALFVASQNGHVQTVEILLQKRALVNSQNIKGNSALFVASQNGHVRTVEILLQKGALVNSQNIKGNSALFVASQNGHVRTVEILLQKGAHVNSQNIEGYSALFVASQNGHVQTVEILLQKGALVNSQNIKGNSALFVASQNGHVRTVEILLQKGAHVNFQNIDLRTPLMIAAQTGHVEVVTTLVERVADVNAKSKDLVTPLTIAARNGHVKIVTTLVERGADVNAKNKFPTKEMFILKAENAEKAGHIVKPHPPRKMCTLTSVVRSQHAIAEKGHVDILRTLVERGADVNAKSKDLVTPLMIAAHNGHVKTVTTLVERGADVNAKEKDGRTALMVASDPGVIQVLTSYPSKNL